MKNNAEQIILASIEALAKGEITIFAIIMDRSGSMNQHGDVPREAINKHITTLKAHPNAGNAVGFVITFADTSTFDIPPQLLKDMPLLPEYDSNGNTLLYGTVLQALKAMLDLKSRSEAKGFKVNLDLTVFTDGGDNLSPDKQEELIQTSAKALEAGAHLCLVAIGLDKDKVSRDMGFPPKDAEEIARDRNAIGTSMIGVTQRTYRTMTGVGRSVPSTPVPPSSH
ncbi:VWA domain-containing protein [Candidatus Uhrbacteria bacterium]|nr:VWA domain-containing protein [Candidatus Uhrbacteria bacterium]